jgi:hypothetical protein
MDTFISEIGYQAAVDKVEAIAELRLAFEALAEQKIFGLELDGHISEKDAKIAFQSLLDWLSDKESDWDLQDNIDNIGKHEEAA